MPASGPRARGARVHPRPCQGIQPWLRPSAASGLVLATQRLGSITGRGTDEATPGRDHVDPQGADRALRRRDRPRRGRFRVAGRRRDCAHLRARERGCAGDARARARCRWARVQPRGGRRRRGALRRVAARQGRRAGQAHRPGRERPGRRGAARPRRRPARQSARRRRSGRDGRVASAGVQGAGRGRASAGEGAVADRDQGDRLDDERRPRPARADHRRPPDGQDGDPDRHDPQPEGHGRRLHLRRDRAEGVDGRAGVREAPRRGRDGVHDDRLRAGPGGGADQMDGPVRGLRDGRALPLQQQARRRDVRRPLEARGRVPPAVAAAAPSAGRSRATSSICTRGCSSAPASSRTRTAAVH